MSSNRPPRPNPDSNRTHTTGAPPQNPENKTRNEYIPHFIAKKPFYIPDDVNEGDYLEHQRLQNTAAPTDLASQKWYDRGLTKGPRATKYRKGACENCGAMTHKQKDCLSRPRAKGARWTGKDIQADEVIQKVELGWDGKRDRWNGYDASEHVAVVAEHEQLEALRRAEERRKKGLAGEEDEEDEDGTKYAEEAEVPGQGFDSQARISTRNLRIREDTAKYLLNLDLDSARYDPKTRTMVDKGATADRAAKLVEEEEFVRSSGDAEAFEKLQKAAWESQERGDKAKLHLQANPTQAEALRKKQEREKAEAAEKKKKELLAKYGGAEYLDKKGPDVEEVEVEVEYTETGALKEDPKKKARANIKSMFEEDKYYGNHTSVWGSWWKNFKWGYACCHSTVKKSYCTGAAGIKANEEAEAMRLGLIEPPTRKVETLQIEAKKDDEQDEVKEERRAEGLSAHGQGKKGEEDEKEGKRKLEHMLGGVTEEEMENYRRKRLMAEDPMAKFSGEDMV